MGRGPICWLYLHDPDEQLKQFGVNVGREVELLLVEGIVFICRLDIGEGHVADAAKREDLRLTGSGSCKVKLWVFVVFPTFIIVFYMFESELGPFIEKEHVPRMDVNLMSLLVGEQSGALVEQSENDSR